MKIKLFYKQFKESLEDFETRINDFTATVDVVDVKFSEATEGDRDNLTATTGLLVLYSDIRARKKMQRCENIDKHSDDWELYDEKGQTPQWVNLTTGKRYDSRNKETLDQFLKRLPELITHAGLKNKG